MKQRCTWRYFDPGRCKEYSTYEISISGQGISNYLCEQHMHKFVDGLAKMLDDRVMEIHFRGLEWGKRRLVARIRSRELQPRP